MGYFTWTDARKEPTLLKNGDYSSKDKIAYGGFAKIVCPDNTEICEPYYEGYGMFGDKDIYELVVDWNKPFLGEIFDRLFNTCPDGFWGSELAALAAYYQRDDHINMSAEINRLHLKDNWKREIGITIACDPEKNKALPYPIKITSTKWHRKYDELVPSYSCQ